METVDIRGVMVVEVMDKVHMMLLVMGKQVQLTPVVGVVVLEFNTQAAQAAPA